MKWYDLNKNAYFSYVFRFHSVHCSVNQSYVYNDVDLKIKTCDFHVVSWGY